MTLNQNFIDFVDLLNEYEAKYLIVGGYALAFHGKPRHTGDLDIWIAPSDTNAAKMVLVMKAFGMASLGLTKKDFMVEGGITQLGYPPLRIDILTEIDGVLFEDAYKNKLIYEVDDLMINYIGLDDLIKNKKASGRSQDKTDVKTLNKMKKNK